MAQFSPTTVTYDRIVYKISKFFDDYYNQRFKNYEEFNVKFQNLIQEIDNSNVGVITKYEPLIKRSTTKIRANLKICRRYFS